MSIGEIIPAILESKRKIRIRIVVFFVVIIYIPVIYNMYSVYTKTVYIIQQQKISEINTLIDKMNLVTDGIINNVHNNLGKYGENVALRRVAQQYAGMTNLSKSRVQEFYKNEFLKLTESGSIFDIILLDNEENIIIGGNNLELKIDDIRKSNWYKELYEEDVMEHWSFYKNIDSRNYIIAAYKLKGSTAENGQIGTDENVGTLAFVVDSKFLDKLCQDEFYKPYNISIYKDRQLVMGLGVSDEIASNYTDTVWEEMKDDGIFISKVNKNNTLIVSRKMEIVDWDILCIANLDDFTSPLKMALKNSLWLIMIVGILATIWILIEYLIVARLVNEKQISQLRLMAVEEANQRFRIYKHDLMNHLQIIQGLMQMGNYEKAYEYSQSMAKEGRLLAHKSHIGIPELESAIFMALTDIEKKGIEIKFDFITLPKDLPFRVYDLVKIMVNLIKNALYALENTESNAKILSIKISEGVGEFIFEVCNNVPVIAENIRESIFNKGFTTKGERGNGLGLHIVKTLAEKNMGTVELVVDENGNRFIIRLPN